MHASDTAPAALAVNELGLDLYRKIGKEADNLVFSPYSIQIALAMAFAGADGETRTQMAKALHYAGGDIHESFSLLRNSLDAEVSKSVVQAKESKAAGGPSEPITLEIANRLFGQRGTQFRPSFLNLVQVQYAAPLEEYDFAKHPDQATEGINQWIGEKTHGRIRNLIPQGALNAQTRLVLANAIYFKAAWSSEFSANATKPEPFHVRGGTALDLPTMTRRGQFGFLKRDGFSAITLPYISGDLQFLVVLPDSNDGLRTIESQITAEVLAGCARAESQELVIHLPKFKLEPPTVLIGDALQSLGMRSAFDSPRGSANFDRMAPRAKTDYLAISEVFHKAFISVDEKGTEAAAATAVAMGPMSVPPRPTQPLVIRIDHPFLYAIQDRQTGACLFLGRVTEPR
jgi:serpin B